MKRVLDLTVRVEPNASTLGYLRDGRLPDLIEPTGPERGRKDVQRLCIVEPFRLGDDPSDIAMDVYLGDSLPHTHAESLWVNKTTVLDELDAGQRWVVRDIASIPAAEFTRSAAVVDLTEEDLSAGTITSQMLKDRGRHIREGEFVLIRTDFVQSHFTGRSSFDLVRDPAFGARRPDMTLDAAEWLVRAKRIVGIATDVPGGSFDRPAADMAVHTYFYTHAVLMIDEMVNMDQLDGDHVFFAGGLVLKTGGIGSSPAAPVAFDPLSTKSAPDIVHMYHEMAPSRDTDLRPLHMRREPAALRQHFYDRYDIRWLQIAHDDEKESLHAVHGDVRPQRDFGSPVRIFSSHLGTHIVGADSTRLLAPIVRNGVLFSLTDVGAKGLVDVPDLEGALSRLPMDLEGSVAILHTGYYDGFHARPDYLEWSPGLAPGAVSYLADHGVAAIVTDFASPDVGDGTPGESTAVLQERGLPIILGCVNLWMLERPSCQVIVSPLPLAGMRSSPCRVVCVENW